MGISALKPLDYPQVLRDSKQSISMVDFRLSLEQANRILQDLSHMNGIDIELDEEGTGLVEVENKYPVTLQLTNSGNFLKLTAYVGEHRSNANPITLEYLLACNYEAEFLKACTVGLCTLTKRFTLSFMHPIRSSDALQLNNSILNLGLVIKDLDGQLEQKARADQQTKTNPGKLAAAGLGNFGTRRL